MTRKILSVVGARPNFMKVAALQKALRKFPALDHRIVHTGQHYDSNMSKVFFQDLELPQPNVYLGVGSGSHAVQTAKVMVEFEKIVLDEKPELVFVVGDVNSTLACSLVCAKIPIPVAHIEAGLRSFDRRMPEEINRIVTDSIATYLFVSEPSGVENLRNEGIDGSKIFLVGNVMIDSLMWYRTKSLDSTIKQTLNLQKKSYALVTLHRPSNVDVKENLEELLAMFEEMSNTCTVVFPVHPRTRKMMEEFKLSQRAARNERLVLCDPVGYLDFLCLMESAMLVITDSGGIQEETTYLGIPCLTLRENTERPITVTEGTNILMGFDYKAVVKETRKISHGESKKGRIPALWDGKSSDRIARIIADKILLD
jgi:UDP-N-acetylglucosamine 2-epimerase (non-hydrolysing)